MRFILNIGLDVQATRTLAADVALQVVRASDFITTKWMTVVSDTEPTLVVEVDYLGTHALLCWQALHQIAVDLHQDCIAVHRPLTGGGALVGPGREKWGPFNPEFFILPDGTRLSAKTAAQAA